MKLVWKYAVVIAAVITIGACGDSGPTPEELRLAQLGATAVLINKPDPEELRMQELVEQYELFMDNAIKEMDLPGGAYAIVKNGRVVGMKTYGVQKRSKAEADTAKIDKHTVFRLASVSKGFTAVLAGLLVEQGYIGWNDKIIDHLPKFKLKSSAATERITVRHSLSHTSGLKRHGTASWITRGVPYSKIFRELRSVSIEEKPAKVFAYQNGMFSVVGEVAKATTELSYGELLDSLIFKPLAMEDASVGYKAMLANDNKGYPHVPTTKRGKRVWESGDIRKNWYNVAPAAGVNASISDMAIWLNAMLGHYPDVLPKRVLHEIFKPHIPLPDDSRYYDSWAPGLTKASYGMGWRIFDYNKHKIVYHGGWIQGYRPEMGFCPKEDVGIVFLTNASKNEVSYKCVRAFFDMYFAPKVSS